MKIEIGILEKFNSVFLILKGRKIKIISVALV